MAAPDEAVLQRRPRPRRRVLLAGLTPFLVFAAHTAFAEHDSAAPRAGITENTTYVFDRMWPTLQQPWYFNRPRDVALDAMGNVYVADWLNHRIIKFNPDGVFIQQWGRLGGSPGLMAAPAGVAVAPSGDVYVVEQFGERVNRFTANGTFVSRWGGSGSAPGRFDGPKGIAVDVYNDVFVADTDNHRIQKFGPTGVFKTLWGGEGNGPGQFRDPEGVLVTGDGVVYVADTGNHRIQIFTLNGSFLGQFGQFGAGPGQFNAPNGLAVDSAGHLYVGDTENHRIQKFSLDGTFVSAWGDFGTGPESFLGLNGLAVSDDGVVYVAHDTPDRIQKFTTDGVFLTQWINAGSESGRFHNPYGVAIDGAGAVYITDHSNSRVQKFSSDGVLLTQWGQRGSGPGQFVFIISSDIDADNAGNVYVTDVGNHRIQKFDSNGVFLMEWGTSGTGNGQFAFPSGISATSTGMVYVADSGNNRIQQFTQDGVFVRDWGSGGGAAGQFNTPRGLATDSDGNVYVADYFNNRIQRFSPDGIFLEAWGSQGSGIGQFNLPSDVAIGVNGVIHVVETINDRVQYFTPDFMPLGAFGQEGAAPGAFADASGIAVDAAGAVVVVDNRNNRVQKFRPVTIVPNARAIVVAAGGEFPGNNLWNATQYCANFAFRALLYQGFTNDTIYYLSSDTALDLSGNGDPDVDADATNANLQFAITQWAQGADSLVLYLVDHGGDGLFRMSETETLTVADLAAWLDQVEPAIAGSIIVVYEACQSGSFLSALSGPGRIVITSSDEAQNAYFLSSGTISFSNFFWTQIFNGSSVGDAFAVAEAAIGQTIAFQTPQITGHALAANTFLGNGAAINQGAPEIVAVSPPQSAAPQGTATLFADVVDPDGVVRVWAVVRPPDLALPSPDNPVLDLPRIELFPESFKGGAERWASTYDGFSSDGIHTVAVYARDTIGNTSLPAVTSVTVNSALRRRAVIAAGGAQSDARWPGVERGVLAAYSALKTQGYRDDDIYFLSPAAISAGVDGANTFANLEFALTAWAADDVQDLVVYFAGSMLGSSFVLNSNTFITANRLRDWFDAIQQIIPGRIVFLVDGPQSAQILPSLARPSHERVLMASADTSDFLADGDISFSNYFWVRVLNGASVESSYVYASRAMRFASGQRAHIDTNGNGVTNEPEDLVAVRSVGIGAGILLAGDDPVIAGIEPGRELGNDTSAVIAVENITSTKAISSVTAYIRFIPPGGGVPTSASLPLEPAKSNRYEAVYNEFTQDGAYRVSVIAVDTAGNASQPATTRFSRNYILDPSDDDIWDAVDIQLVINAALGVGDPGVHADVNNDSAVDAVDVQLVINAVLGLGFP